MAGMDHLPPGFRFHPTDEEIITHYLTPKILNHGFTAPAMGAVDLNKCEPWDLPGKAKIHGDEKEWYFFCQRDRKYPTGMRTNRATESGYWKATGKDKEICGGRGAVVGMKKTLVFYAGRAPKGEKTNWVMHEFRIEAARSALYNLPKKDEWVVCRVFHKNGSRQTSGGSRFTDELMAAEDAQAPLFMDPVDLFFPGDESFEEIITMANYSPCSFDDDMMIMNCGMPGETTGCLNQDWRLATQSSAVAGRRCKAEQLSSDDVVSN